VHVLEHEHHRCEVRQQPGHALEEAVPRREHVSGTVVREQPVRLAAERGDERAVCEGRADQRCRLPGQQQRLARAVEFRYQAALADASRTGDQQQAWLPGHRTRVNI